MFGHSTAVRRRSPNSPARTFVRSETIERKPNEPKDHPAVRPSARLARRAGPRPHRNRSGTDRPLPAAARGTAGRNHDQSHRNRRPDAFGRYAALAGRGHSGRLRARARLPGAGRCGRKRRELPRPENRNRRRVGIRLDQASARLDHAAARRAAVRHPGRRPALLHLSLFDALPDGSLRGERQAADRAGPPQSERILCGRPGTRSEAPFVRRHAPDSGSCTA